MSILQVELEDDLMALLHQSKQPASRVAKELIVLELYRRASISSGKAAELLGMEKQDFIAHASGLGIPYIQMSAGEWDEERKRASTL